MQEEGSISLPSSPSQTFIAFAALLQTAATRDIKLVPIRHRDINEKIALSGGDYDFILPNDQHPLFLSLVFEIMSQAGINFSIDQTKQEKKVLHLHAPEEKTNITLEIWSHLEVRDPAKQTHKQISWNDLAPHLQEKNGYYHLPLLIEGYYYLSHLHTKNKSSSLPEVKRRLQHYQQLAQNQEASTLSELLEQLQHDASIAQIAKQANLELVKLGVLREKSTNLETLKQRFQDLKRQYRKHRMRSCARRKIFAFVGPDGVGKTTLIEQCRDILRDSAAYFRFKKLFRGSLLYTLLYVLRYSALAKRQQNDLPKNEFDEQQASNIFWIALINYPKLWLRARLFCTQLSDRYYSDFLFENLRTNAQPPRLSPNWENRVHFIPKPAWLIHLDAKTSVIHSRKKELSAEAIDTYRQGVFTLYLANPAPYYSYINTGHDLAHSRESLRLSALELGVACPSTKTEEYELDQALKLGEGNERICYLHPTETDKIIKVTKLSSNNRNQNQIEALYLRELELRRVPFSHIPRQHYWVNTTEGKGLVFDRISNDDNSPLLSLADCVQQGFISKHETNRMLSELYAYLYRHAIIFADVGLNNLVCHKQNNNWHLTIIDGLGARRMGLKFFLYRKIHLLARMKLQRQWKIFMQKINSVSTESTIQQQ